MCRSWKLALLASLCLLPSVGRAQDSPLEDFYSLGVQAYFSGDHRSAFNYLSTAISAGSTDPRAYYFRGLSELNLGRAPDARADFMRGAQLETAEGPNFYDISHSLERVQGRTRLTLESYRSNARIAAAKARERRRMERYDLSPSVDQPAAPATPAGPPERINPPAAVPMEPAKPAGPPVPPTPAKPGSPAGGNPFGDK